MRSVGTYISVISHVGLIGWLTLGWGLSSNPLPLEVSEVSVVSSKEFAALLAATTLQMDVVTPSLQMQPQTEEPLTVTITATGEVTIQNTITALDELVVKLSAIASERTSDRIFLRADGANDWDTVAKIMGALNAGGFSNIGLVTDVGGPAFDGSDG